MLTLIPFNAYFYTISCYKLLQFHVFIDTLMSKLIIFHIYRDTNSYLDCSIVCLYLFHFMFTFISFHIYIKTNFIFKLIQISCLYNYHFMFILLPFHAYFHYHFIYYFGFYNSFLN